MKIKEFLKNWKWFELVFLVVSIITITVCFIFEVNKNLMSFIASILGIVSVMLVAKGLVIAPFLEIAYNILYAIISISQRYYGEAIIYFGLMTPIGIFSFVAWIKNRNKKDSAIVQVNKIHEKEFICLAYLTFFITFGFYFLLKALNTSELFISTISLTTSAVASYLMLRRCKYYALGFVANDIILIVMWSLVVVKNGLGYLPTLIGFCVFLINDAYGFIHWGIEEKRQGKQLAKKLDNNSQNV